MEWFLPNWTDFCRREEGVQAFYFDGSDSAAADLMSSFPDNFSIRTTADKNGDSISRLCMQDNITEICVLKPDTWIIRDSCGRFYTYDKQFFELAFVKPTEKKEDIENLAREMYKSEQSKQQSLLSGTIPKHWEDLDNKEQSRRIIAMANFVKDFVVFRR